MLLTDGGTWESGSVFSPTRVGVAAFQTSFGFQLSSGVYGPPGGNGFTFVLQANGPDALGSAGIGLGYGPAGGTATAAITNSVAIKLDVQSADGQPVSTTGLYLNGVAPQTPEISTLPNVNLRSGYPMSATITYADDLLSLTVTGAGGEESFTTSFPVDIPRQLGGQTGYAGFTGSTGAEAAVQLISDWQYSSSQCCTTGKPSYPDGFASSADMVLNGDAQISDGSLQLTHNTANEVSSAFFPAEIPLQTFTSDFDVKLSEGDGEGFTFVLQGEGPNAVGSAGSGLGYGPSVPGAAKIGKSVAIKFDLHSDDGEGSNSTGVYVDGASPTTPCTYLTPSVVNLHSGHSFHIRLSATVGSLTLYITDLTRYETFKQTYAVNIPKEIGANVGYVGFTASTGDIYDSISILNWSMTSY